jgi:energy-coupling factor transporter ATP-binding protein EcfA2
VEKDFRTAEIGRICAEIATWKPLASARGAHDLQEKINHHERVLKRLQTEQSKPARLCLVGRFSSGKTTILSTMLGVCGQLKVAENPTTGNIVEFTLHRGDKDVQGTQLRDWRVRIVDRDTAEKILLSLLRTAASILEKEGKSDRDLLQRAMDRNSPTHWIDAVNWALAARGELTKEIKAVAFEVYRFARVVEQLLEHSGKVFSISQSQAERLMTLDFDPNLVYECDLSTLPRLSQKSRELAFEAMSDDDLRAVFPAVCKIQVEADLPDAVADLITKDEQFDFQIVDCAGFHAEGSSIRDSTICSVELQNVDAVLAIIDSRLPGENLDWISELTRTWGWDAKSRVLTAVNRFDELSLRDEISVLQRLSESADPLSLEELRRVCGKTVFVLLQAAARTVQDGDMSRVILTSAMAYIDHQLSRGLRLGTEHFLADKIASSRYEWRATGELWGRIGARLAKGATTDESRAVAQMLLDLSDDGGGKRLLGALRSHLQARGVAWQRERLLREWSQFCMVHEELRDLVDALPGDFTQTCTESRVVAESVKQVAYAYRIVGDAMVKIPPDLQMRPPGLSSPVKIIPLIELEGIGRVFDWECWRDTLNSMEPTREPCMVPILANSARGASLRKLQVPLKSDDFEGPFLNTCSELIALITSLLPKLVEHVVEDVNSRVEQQLGAGRAELLMTLQSAVTDDAVRATLGPAFSDFGHAVRLCCGDNDLRAEIESELRTVLAAFRDQADAGYPLQRTRDGGYAVVYPWNEQIYSRYHLAFESRHRHVMRIYRLRHTLIDAVLYFLKNCLHELQNRLHETVNHQLDFIQGTLESTSKQISAMGSASNPGDLFSNLLDPA